MSCKHKALKSAAPKRQFDLWQCLIYKGWFRREWAPRNDHTMNHLSCSPVAITAPHKFCVVMVVSDGLKSTLIYGLIWKNFPGSACPQTPLGYTAKNKCALHAPHGRTNPHSMCAPPFFNLWIRPHARLSWISFIRGQAWEQGSCQMRKQNCKGVTCFPLHNDASQSGLRKSCSSYVGEHQCQLAHRCSLCENFHTYIKWS